MKKKHLFLSLIAMTLLVGCDYNEKNFEGLDKLSQPTDVKKVEYTLIDADYATIAANKANIAIAEAAGDEVKSQLAAIKSKLCLSDVISANIYLPAFLTDKWFTADAGSSVKITYNKSVNAPAYIAEVEAAKSYKLVTSDYEVAWEDQAIDYFTPSKPAATYLPRILKAAMPDAQKGAYATVEYNYSPTDPPTGGEVNPYNKIADAAQGAAGEYNVKGTVAAIYAKGFVLTDGKASILVYVNKLPNLSLGDVVAVKGTTSAYAGLMQFPATSQISKLDVGEEGFSYPKFVSMTGADMDAYVAAPTIKPIVYTGTLKINGNYYDIKEIEGATTATGSLSNPVNGTIDAELNGKKVTVTGYAIGTSSGRVNTVVVNVVEEGESATTSSVGVVALAATGMHSIRGTVVATYARGFLVSDGTGSVLVYLNAAHTYVVGDVVTVSGTISKYSGLVQFPNTSTVTKVGTAVVAYPTVIEMVATDIDAYVDAPCAQYVTYKGTLTISADEKYYNVAIDGTTVQGSLSYPNGGLISPDLNGKEIIVTGYSIGVSGSTTKFMNTMVLSIVEASAAPAISRLAFTRAAGEKRYAVYQFDGSMWTAAAGMAMVNPADYRQMGISNNYFSSSAKPDNYLTQFMVLTYPYAQEGDTKAAVYHYFDKDITSISAEEYVFTQGAWMKNINIIAVTDQFVFNGTQWNYDPSVVIRLQKNDAFSKEFFQVIVDWVKANKGDDLIDRGTAEYYYGCSAYYGNVEFAVSYWRPYYVGKSDEELTKMIKEHIEEKDGFLVPALKKYHADADLVDGIDVTYTINFDAHVTTATPVPYTIKYLVTGKGQFEYIKDSFQEVK